MSDTDSRLEKAINSVSPPNQMGDARMAIGSVRELDTPSPPLPDGPPPLVRTISVFPEGPFRILPDNNERSDVATDTDTVDCVSESDEEVDHDQLELNIPSQEQLRNQEDTIATPAPRHGQYDWSIYPWYNVDLDDWVHGLLYTINGGSYSEDDDDAEIIIGGHSLCYGMGGVDSGW